MSKHQDNGYSAKSFIATANKLAAYAKRIARHSIESLASIYIGRVVPSKYVAIG